MGDLVSSNRSGPRPLRFIDHPAESEAVPTAGADEEVVWQR
jgi:hypothetical protein